MNAYVDSSVLLRIVLGESGAWTGWPTIDRAVSSELIRVECLRTIDRARVQLHLPDDETARRRADVIEALATVDLVALGSPVLDRAAEPFPTSLGSLDALHLATALAIRDQYDDLVVATHDLALATAARAVGFRVEGTAS